MNRAFGKASATIIMGTPGGNSAIGRTDVACRNGHGSSRRNGDGTDDHTQSARLAGSRRRPARGRAFDGRGWLLGGSLLLDRLRAELRKARGTNRRTTL